VTSGYRRSEEIAHAVSHGFGVLLALAGMVALVVQARHHGNGWRLATGLVFGATLVLLYLSSTLYHSFTRSPAAPFLRSLDHVAIYLLIAGTYTPLTIVALGGGAGWTLFALVWVAAMVGIGLEVRRHSRRPERSRRDHVVTAMLYLGMGWCIVLAFGPFRDSVPAAGVTLFVIGGLVYSAGFGFYAWKRLPFHHLIWHLCVLAGSIFHYFAVLLYVIPVRG
jgi:hemolysin III